jgi:hypothetical protein
MFANIGRSPEDLHRTQGKNLRSGHDRQVKAEEKVKSESPSDGVAYRIIGIVLLQRPLARWLEDREEFGRHHGCAHDHAPSGEVDFKCNQHLNSPSCPTSIHQRFDRKKVLKLEVCECEMWLANAKAALCTATTDQRKPLRIR